MDKESVITSLIQKNLISNRGIHFEPISGGVSSDIFLLKEGDTRFVIKQARTKLKVEDDWYADPSRNRTEQNFVRYIQKFLPGSVPDILWHDEKHQFFVMEYLDDSYINWKANLMKGVVHRETICKSADLLAAIHLHSFRDPEARETFDTTEGFKSLRIEPYLVTTAHRHPKLRKIFLEEAERLETCREGLVHGDFSPKNIMAGPDRIVLLDHEVAWYGDPAFDVAFLLTHLCLKMLYYRSCFPDTIAESSEAGPLGDEAGRPEDMAEIFWSAYFDKLSESPADGRIADRRIYEMKKRTGRLLLMLMLARMDGKSPVEYFGATCKNGEAAKNIVRNFVYDRLPKKVYLQSDIHTHWKTTINSISF